MQTMLWPDEVRTPDFANLDDDGQRHQAGAGDGRHAGRVSWPGTTSPDEYEDDYAAGASSAGRGQARGRRGPGAAGAEDDAGEVVDLLAALQRSVERAKAARGEPTGKDAAGDDAAATTRPTTAAGDEPQEDKAPARKAPARKTAAKKTAPAKKAAARKSAPARKTTKKSASADDAPRKKAAS